MKKTKRQQTIEKYMELDGAQKEVYHHATIITYERNNYPCLAIWRRRGYKPSLNYRYRTIEERDNEIISEKRYIDSEVEQEKREDEERNEMFSKIKEGTILYSLWGWEQTNVDFYKVVAKKNKTLTLVELAQDKTETGFMSGECTPIIEKEVGETFKKRMGKSGIKLNSYSWAYLWDGKPKGYSSYA